MDTSSVLNSLLLALAGVVVGWLLQGITAEVKEQREIRRSVSTAAAVILARLKKMQMARKYSKTKEFDDEKRHLGPDSDNFLQAVSRRRKINKNEEETYDGLCELLMCIHDGGVLDTHIVALIQKVKKMVVYAA